MARGSLVQGYAITTSQTGAYQAVSIAKAQIHKAQISNPSASVVTVNVWITPDSSTTPTNAHKVLTDKQVGSGDTYIAVELIGEYVNGGGRIYIQANTAGAYLWVDGNTIKAE